LIPEALAGDKRKIRLPDETMPSSHALFAGTKSSVLALYCGSGIEDSLQFGNFNDTRLPWKIVPAADGAARFAAEMGCRLVDGLA
jgi:hypothetical protein